MREQLMLLGAAAALVAIVIADRDSYRDPRTRRVAVPLAAFAAVPCVAVYALAPLFGMSDITVAVVSLFVVGPGTAYVVVAIVRMKRIPNKFVPKPALVLATLFLLVAGHFAGQAPLLLLGLVFAVFVFVAMVVRTADDSVGVEHLGAACRASLALMVGTVSIVALVNRHASLGACSAKCADNPFDTIISPLVPNGNFLGMTAAFLVPFAVCGLSRWQMPLVVGSAGVLVVLSGSRWAIVVWLVAGLGICGQLVGRRIVHQVSATLALIVGLGLSLMPFYLSYGLDLFTGRGGLWVHAKALLEDSWLFGRGPQRWLDIFINDPFVGAFIYSPHTMWLDIAMSVGVIGALIVAFAIGLQIWEATPTVRSHLMTYYGVVFAAGGLESFYVPYFLTAMPMVALLPLMLSAQSESTHERLVATTRELMVQNADFPVEFHRKRSTLND